MLNNFYFLSNKKYFYNFNVNMCKYTTDIYSFKFYKSVFKHFFFFGNNFKKVENLSRNSNILFNFDLNFFKKDLFVIYNINVRNLYPILNFKIREASIFNFSKVLILGFILNINYYYDYLSNNFLFFKKYLYLIKNDNFLFLYSQNNSKNNSIKNILSKYHSKCFKDLSCSNSLNLNSFEFEKKNS